MHRTVIPAALLLAATGSASAESYICRSLAGEPPATLAFQLDFAGGAYSVASAQFQIEGDLGYSTKAEEPSSLATVSGAEIMSAEDVGFSFHYTDADYDGDVASVRIVTLSEGAHSLAAGVLQVSGGGLWAISCDLDYEG